MALFSGQSTGTIEVPVICDVVIGLEGRETIQKKKVETYIFEVDTGLHKGIYNTQVWFESQNHEGYIYVEQYSENELHIYGWYDDEAVYHTFQRDAREHHKWTGALNFELTPDGFETNEGVTPYYKVGIVSKKL